MILTALMADKRAPETTQELPLLTRAATVVPGSLNEDDRTVDVIWTTGAPVLRRPWDPFYEQLGMEPKQVRLKRLNNGAPFLDTHDDSDVGSVIGVVVAKSAVIDGGKGTAKVRFAKAEDDPDADMIFRKIKDGIIQNVSVGYQVYRLEQTDKAIGGIPVWLATDWEPYELSAVPMGADDGAGFRSTTSERNPCVFVTRQQEKPMIDPEDKTTNAPVQPGESAAVAATRAATQARIDGAKERAAMLIQEREAATAEERVRSAEIRKIGKQSGLGEDWALKLIEAGTGVDEARAVAFNAMTKRDGEFEIDGTHSITAGDDARDKRIRCASSWLIERTGKRSLIEKAKAKSPELFTDLDFSGGNPFRGMSPVEIARDLLESSGVKVRGMDKMRMLGIAFTHRNAGMQTASDFAVLFESTLHKLLLGAYILQDVTWPMFCGTDDVPDFRPSNRYRTGSLPSLPKIAEHGEYKTAAIPDGAKFQISTERHGEIFSLSREAIINDDMGALANLASEFGKAAARTIENDVYAFLAQNGGLGPTQTDAQPFFHANRANANPTGSAISVVGLDSDRVLMRAQKDPSGLDFLSLSPASLVVPDALGGTAKVINTAQYDPDTANKLQRPNIAQNMFGAIVSTPRLAPTSTRRYLFADPAQCAAIVVAYLEGYGRGPIMESQQGWRTDGVEWKITQYAKAQAGDPKGAVTNAGV